MSGTAILSQEPPHWRYFKYNFCRIDGAARCDLAVL